MWTRVASWQVRSWAWLGWAAGRAARRLRTASGAGAGQSMVEYAMITALIVVGVMAAVQYFTQGVTTVFQHIVQTITKL